MASTSGRGGSQVDEKEFTDDQLLDWIKVNFGVNADPQEVKQGIQEKEFPDKRTGKPRKKRFAVWEFSGFYWKIDQKNWNCSKAQALAVLHPSVPCFFVRQIKSWLVFQDPKNGPLPFLYINGLQTMDFKDVLMWKLSSVDLMSIWDLNTTNKDVQARQTDAQFGLVRPYLKQCVVTAIEHTSTNDPGHITFKLPIVWHQQRKAYDEVTDDLETAAALLPDGPAKKTKQEEVAARRKVFQRFEAGQMHFYFSRVDGATNRKEDQAFCRPCAGMQSCFLKLRDITCEKKKK